MISDFYVWAESARCWDSYYKLCRSNGDTSGACMALGYKSRAIYRMRKCAARINGVSGYVRL